MERRPSAKIVQEIEEHQRIIDALIAELATGRESGTGSFADTTNPTEGSLESAGQGGMQTRGEKP